MAKFRAKMKTLKVLKQSYVCCYIIYMTVPLNLEAKMPYLGVLDSNFQKLLSYLKSALSICLIAKSGAKIKILKFGTKNA